MRVIFWLKSLKFDVHLRNAAKNWEICFKFLDNWTWIVCDKSFLLGREYLSWAVYVLKNSPKISDITKRDVVALNFCQSD